jgi:glycosyltransferase involved in cell wall biosynthesis
MKKVSIIIPVYNVEPYIERCLLSVLNQTYENIEIILVDDCGQDKSIEIANQIIQNHKNGYKTTILKHHQNKGLSEARNTGIRAATGDYLYFLDSDDEITLNCIETLISLVEKYPEVEMVQGNTQTIPTPSPKADWRNILYKNFPEYIDDNYWVREHFYVDKKNIPVNAWNKLVKRTFIFENKLFFKEGIIHEDVLWVWFVAKKLKRISFLTDYTYIHYVTNGSIMQSNNILESLKSWSVILDNMFQSIDQPFFYEQRRRAISILHSRIKALNLIPNAYNMYSIYEKIIKKNIKKELKQHSLLYALLFVFLLLISFVYKIVFKIRHEKNYIFNLA